MKTARFLPDGTVVTELPNGSTVSLKGHTDWAQVQAMSEKTIEQNSLSDPDNPPLSDAELRRLESVPNLKKIRQQLHLSQSQFAQKFHLSVRTVQDWEQGRSQPDQTAQVLLKVIAHNPKAVSEALNSINQISLEKAKFNRVISDKPTHKEMMEKNEVLPENITNTMRQKNGTQRIKIAVAHIIETQGQLPKNVKDLIILIQKTTKKLFNLVVSEGTLRRDYNLKHWHPKYYVQKPTSTDTCHNDKMINDVGSGEKSR